MAVHAPGDLPPLDDHSHRIVEDFERAWVSGRPEIVDHLEQHPDRPLRLLVELVAIDLENRVKRGEPALPEEYEARFPELAADASSVAELHRSFERCRHTAVNQSTVEQDVFRTIPMSSSEKERQSPFPFLAPPTAPGSIGTLAHYTIVRSVGQGAFGTVFEAFDEKLHRRVAIKMLSIPELAATSPPRKRFLREARSMAAISHENVVRVYAVEEQPIPYLVMEYVDGGTLQDRMDAEGPLNVPEIVNMSRQVAAALAAAHEIGLIHRDIKPSNVLLDRGPGRLVKLTDFGLARALDDASMTRSGTVVGTPMYMSPEQAGGSTVDSRTDLFSLGSLMYVMTTGRLPFRAPSTINVLKRLVDETPRPIPEIIPETPRWLVDLIARLHAKKPEDRIQTARQVEQLLAKAQMEGEVAVEQAAAARPARAGQGAATPAGTALNSLGWIAAAVVLAALAGVAAWYRGAAGSRTVTVVSQPPPQTALTTAVDATSAFAPPPAIAAFDASQARTHQEAWARHLGVPVVSTNSIGIKLVVVPPGRFTMGENAAEVDVTLSRPFLLGQTEVTQGQWSDVMGSRPWTKRQYTIEDPDAAASWVSWDDAVVFCKTLTERERLSGRIGVDQSYRLPTEAEWEFACRAGSDTNFSFGDDENLIDDCAWFGAGWDDGLVPGGNTIAEPHPHRVGLKRPNPFGLYDVHGNVWEWVADFYGAYPSGPIVDPLGQPKGSDRVSRGGSWVATALDCRSAVRYWQVPSSRNIDLGFRITLDPSMQRSKESEKPAANR